MSTTDSENRNLSDEQVIHDEEFDVTGLLLDYLSHWKIFVISLIVCIGVAFCYIRTVTPTYRVDASVYLNDDNDTKTNAITISAETPLFDAKGKIDETQIEIMKSRNTLLKIIDSLDLSYSYYQVHNWNNEPLYRTNPVTVAMDSASLAEIETPIIVDLSANSDGGLEVKVQDKDNDFTAETELAELPGVIETPAGNIYLTKNGEQFDDFEGTNRIIIQHPNTVAKQIATNLTIQFPEESSTILNFSYISDIPELGEDILEMMIYFYNEHIIEDKNRSAIQTEAFIIDRLIMISDELRDVENRLRDYRQSHNITDLEAQVTLNLTQKSSTEAEVNELASQERILNDLLIQARNLEVSANRDEIMTLPAISPNTELNKSIDQFNEAVRNYNVNRRAMTPEQEYITSLITNLTDQRNQILNDIEAARRIVIEQRKNIARLESQSSNRLAAQPNIDKGLQEIFREQTVKVNIYTFLLQKREEIALQKSLATPTAQFIDDPSVTEQVAPRSTLIYILGLLAGLLIPGLWILVKRQLFPTFKEKEDLQRVTSIPIISEVCQATNTDSDIVVGKNISTPAAELFRLLRNNISFARTGTEKKVIMLTSSISGEGKTFVALNLAMTYALTQKRVVVIGLDIRRPVLAHKFGFSNRVGVTSYLSEQVSDINEILFRLEGYDNLFVMPAGPVPPNPNELLMSDRMKEMFDYLREEFDYIIVDSAPIGLVSDGFLIVPHTDMQLFIIRASYTKKKGIKILHEAVNNGQLPKAYIVLNDVNIATRTYSYRRYGNYHGPQSYVYGYGSKKDSNKRPWYKRLLRLK